MDNTITSVKTPETTYPATPPKPRIIPREMQVDNQQDVLDIGGHSSVSNNQAMGIVLERSYAKLRSIVGDAKTALGISEDTVLDTSPEATAGRIADFALGAYDKWRTNHKDLAEEDARKQFASFIGDAIGQGIEEARGILSSLNALNGDIDANITKTHDIIKQRLDDFAKSVNA